MDLTQYEGLTDKEVASKLGATGASSVSWIASAVARERSGEYDAAVPPGRSRCEAGQKEKGRLRCIHVARPDKRWCGWHDPDPLWG